MLNIPAYIGKSMVDFVVGIAKHTVSHFCQRSIPYLVCHPAFFRIVLGTIQFDDQLGLGTIKIHNVGPQYLLPIKGKGGLPKKIIP